MQRQIVNCLCCVVVLRYAVAVCRKQLFGQLNNHNTPGTEPTTTPCSLQAHKQPCVVKHTHTTQQPPLHHTNRRFTDNAKVAGASQEMHPLKELAEPDQVKCVGVTVDSVHMCTQPGCGVGCRSDPAECCKLTTSTVESSAWLLELPHTSCTLTEHHTTAAAACRSIYPASRFPLSLHTHHTLPLSPPQVASALEFFLRPENDFVTGQVLAVDGGLSTLHPHRAQEYGV